MEEIIEDIIKIYLACVDSYIPKCYQVINDKYTLIDKCMLTTYLYTMIIENKKLKNNEAIRALSNYLIKQTIYSEVGNVQYQTTETEKIELYNEVIENVICDRFKYMNRIMKKIKYTYTPTAENDYKNLICFLENIADYAILKKMIRKGNKDATEYLAKRFNLIKNSLDDITNDDIFVNEKKDIIDLIVSDSFEENKYGQLLKVALNLRDVYRFSIINSRVVENVLFHQYTVAVVCFCLATYSNEKLGEKFDLYNILMISLYHDFGEYKGTEITSYIKKFNERTIKMFDEIEKNDVMELKEKLGKNLCEYIIAKDKNEPESYICDVLDKLLPFFKMWIEVKYYNNLVYIKHIPTIYKKRLSKFARIENINGFRNKSFYMDLLIQSYIFIKENLIDFNIEFANRYITDNELIELKNEIKLLKNNPEEFFN